LNPFNLKELIFSTEDGWVYGVNDINLKKTPTKLEQLVGVGKSDQQGLKETHYCPHSRDQIYLVTNKEIAVYDLELKNVRFFY
jgi:hypothetical protein